MTELEKYLKARVQTLTKELESVKAELQSFNNVAEKRKRSINEIINDPIFNKRISDVSGHTT